MNFRRFTLQFLRTYLTGEEEDGRNIIIWQKESGDILVKIVRFLPDKSEFLLPLSSI